MARLKQQLSRVEAYVPWFTHNGRLVQAWFCGIYVSQYFYEKRSANVKRAFPEY